MESAAARPQVLIVRDTRESGPMLEAALAAGVAEGGWRCLARGRAADARRLDPRPPARPRPRRGRLRLPQPLAAQRGQVLRRGWAQAGGRRGGRNRGPGRPRARSEAGAPLGRVRELDGALDDYRRALLSAFRLDLSGRRVLLDCANGATYRAAPSVFERLGAAVETIGRGARRAQHQRGLRLDPPGAAGRGHRPKRRGDRLRLRRRRRPGGGRGRPGSGSRRRRAAGALRPASGRRRRAPRRRRRDRDEQLRLSPGDGRGGNRGRRPRRWATAT